MFPVLDNSVSTLLALHETTCIEPKLSIEKRSTLSALGIPVGTFTYLLTLANIVY